MWTVFTVACSLVIIGGSASAIPDNFNRSLLHNDESVVRTKRFFGGLAEVGICTKCRHDDSSFTYVYEEQRHEFGMDDAEEVSNPLTCGTVQCEVTVTHTSLRSDTYTKGYKVGWNVGLDSKIADAVTFKLGHTGEVSWSWSNTKTESQMTARKCPGRPGQRVTVMFKPRYRISEGILHHRTSEYCKNRCSTQDKPSEPYKLKTYGKRNGYLVGEEFCRTDGTEIGGGEKNVSNGGRGNCRGRWSSMYNQWCDTNCAMNNCPSSYCTCS